MRHFVWKYHKEKMSVRKRDKEDQRQTQEQRDGLVYLHSAIQGKSSSNFTSLGQTFAFTSPDGFQVVWSQPLLRHSYCLG